MGWRVHGGRKATAVKSGRAAAALHAFDGQIFQLLHPVVTFRRGADGALTRYTDLGEALGPYGAKDSEEWRVHFHVPVFLETLPEFGTTQAFLKDILAIHRQSPISPHLEVETYTWDVLPADLVAGSVEDAVTRELHWVMSELTA